MVAKLELINQNMFEECVIVSVQLHCVETEPK